MKKNILLNSTAILTAGIMAAMPVMAEETADSKLYVNGKAIENAQALELKNDNGENTLFVPVRAICENLGFTVEWNDEARRVELTNLPSYITFYADKDGYTFAKTAAMPLGAKPQIVDDRTYVPSNFVEEILGGTFTEDAGKVFISWGEDTDDYLRANLKETTEDGRVLITNFIKGDILLNITDETVISDEDGNALAVKDLPKDKELKVKMGDAMTLSLPPQSNALEIIVTKEDCQVIKEGVISEILDKSVVIGNYDEEGFYQLNLTDDAVIIDENGNMAGIDALKAGMNITTSISPISTKSLPPQSACYGIKVTKQNSEVKIAE